MDVDGEKEDVEMASDSESEKESNSSDEESKKKEYNQKKTELQERLRTDVTDYYGYVELIQVLSNLGQLDELRKVREDFSKQFPLTPALWKSWIEDEKKIPTTVEEKEHVKDLFERALKDYLSIDIWLDYVQYSIGLMADGNQIESVRAVMERAVATCGHHVTSGSLLWKVYREFEMLVLNTLPNSGSSEEEAEKKKRDQLRRIAQIFRRQLELPLFEMEKTYQELRLWLEEQENAENIINIESLESLYKKALEKLSRILTFEDNLMCCESDASLQYYQKYLEFEKSHAEDSSDKFRVRCLYERALTDNALNTNLWDDYIKYLSDVMKVPEDTMSACYRATRNLPGEGKFWSLYMILMERSMKPRSEITELLNRSLTALSANAKGTKSIWLSYIYYLRRHLYSISSENEERRNKIIEDIRSVIDMASDHMNKYFGFKGDQECDLLLWRARFEAETARNLKNFRDIWAEIMETDHQKSSYYWLKRIHMEWQYGDSKHVRKYCKTALEKVTDSPKNIAALWLEYETNLGSLDSFLYCQKICDESLKHYVEKKKVYDKFDDKKKKPPPKPDKKKTKEEVKGSTNNIEVPTQRKITGFAKTDSLEKPKKETSSNTTGTFIPHDPSSDDRTVFISNLDYTVTEDDVTKVMSSCGTIEQFRLVRDFKGRSKGYGYMVFSTKNEAKEALNVDRTPINQRPMFVSECDPNKSSRKAGLRFSKGMEKNKLFVRGLPFSLDKAGVEKIFSPYGTLKDIRIVTYRNGHSKGLAYIEFEDEVSAAHALVKTDGLVIDDKTISVAISDPPERKNELAVMSGTTLGAPQGNSAEFGSRGRGRTQLSFVPRSLSVTARNTPPTPEKMDIAEPTPDTNKKSLGNADFRDMFLKK